MFKMEFRDIKYRGLQILFYELRIEQKNIEKDQLELAINSYYSNLSWYKNLALKCRLIKVHPLVKAYEHVLTRLNKGERLIEIIKE